MAVARMPAAFFDLAEHHLPPEQPVGPPGGRPPLAHLLILTVLWFVLATGCRWEDVPPRDGLFRPVRPPLPATRGRTWLLGPPARRHAAAAAPGRQARPRRGHHRRRQRAGLRRRRGDQPQ